jgi:hypothetical protein
MTTRARIPALASCRRTAYPMAVAMQQSKTLRLTTVAMVVRHDGFEFSTEGSQARIHDRKGQVTGAMMDLSRRHLRARNRSGCPIWHITIT